MKVVGIPPEAAAPVTWTRISRRKCTHFHVLVTDDLVFSFSLHFIKKNIQKVPLYT